MQRNSRQYSSTDLGMTRWKAAALTVLFSLAAGPALASNGTAGDGAATAGLASGTTALEQDGDAVDIRRLTERVVGLERRVDRLGVAAPAPAPTAAELKRARQEEERQAEFQKQVWTMP
jgi:hypothetical protein